MNSEAINPITIPHIKLIIIFFGFLYKITKLAIKIKVSIIDLKPK